MTEPVKFKVVPLRELEQFARECDRSVSGQTVVPINLQRARAQVHNPCADPDDCALLVAYIGEECVGYLGFVPGVLRTGDSDEKVVNLSTIFVSPDHRGRRLAQTIVKRAFELPHDFVLTGMVAGTEVVYQRMGVPAPEEPLPVLRLTRRGWQTRALRQARRVRWAFGLRAAKLAPKSIRRDAELLALHGHNRFPPPKNDIRVGPYRFSCISADELDAFPEPKRSEPFFYRGPKVIRWMLEHSWIPREATPGYYFSSERHAFEHLLFGVYDSDGPPVGFVAVSLSAFWQDLVLKVWDHQLRVDNPTRCLVGFAAACARHYRMNTIQLPSICEPVLSELGRGWDLQREQRLYYCQPMSETSPMARALKTIRLDNCDSDQAFL